MYGECSTVDGDDKWMELKISSSVGSGLQLHSIRESLGHVFATTYFGFAFFGLVSPG